MNRARQIKEEVNMATSDLKQNLDKNNEMIGNKAGMMISLVQCLYL